jgi:hypothetical protein
MKLFQFLNVKITPKNIEMTMWDRKLHKLCIALCSPQFKKLFMEQGSLLLVVMK